MMDKKRTIIIVTGAALIFVAMAAVIIITSILIRRQSQELALLSETVKTELSDTSSAITSVKENLILLTRDTSDIRKVLRLPEISYPLLDSAEEEKTGNEEMNLVFFHSVDLLLERYTSTKNAAFFQDTLQSDGVTSFLLARDLHIDIISELSAAVSRGEERYFSILFLPEENLFSITDISGETNTAADSDGISLVLEENYPQVEDHVRIFNEKRALVSKTHQDSRIKNALREKELTLSDASPSPGRAAFQLIHDSSPVLTIGVERDSLSFFIEEASFVNYDSFMQALQETVRTLDTRTDTDRFIDEQKRILLELGKDGGFQLLLENNELSIARRFREDSDYFYLDISDKAGVRVGAFAIQKLLGEVYLTDSEDIPITALKTLGLAPAGGDEKKN